MSAKTVTEEEGTGREAVLRAMQEAAECVSGKNGGVPKGYKRAHMGRKLFPTPTFWRPSPGVGGRPHLRGGHPQV